MAEIILRILETHLEVVRLPPRSRHIDIAFLPRDDELAFRLSRLGYADRCNSGRIDEIDLRLAVILFIYINILRNNRPCFIICPQKLKNRQQRRRSPSGNTVPFL